MGIALVKGRIARAARSQATLEKLTMVWSEWSMTRGEFDSLVVLVLRSSLL